MNGIIIIGLGLNVSRKYMIMSYDINELINFTCHKLHIHRDLRSCTKIEIAGRKSYALQSSWFYLKFLELYFVYFDISKLYTDKAI